MSLVCLEWCAKNQAVDVDIVAKSYADTYLGVFEEQKIRDIAEGEASFVFNADFYRVGCLLKKHQIVRVVKINVIKIAVQWFVDKRKVTGEAQV